MKREMRFRSCDGINNIHAVCWEPEGEAKAVLQIVHGMCEYIERYEEFAEYMNSQGIAVVGHDQLGHGLTVSREEDYGFIAEENPVGKLMGDIRRMYRGARKHFADVPFFLLGHSMGSYEVRKYSTLYGTDYAGIIIVGTGNENPVKTEMGLTTINAYIKLKGMRDRNKVVTGLMFGGGDYAKYDMTGKDLSNAWITKDESVAGKYYNDPFCTFTFTLNGYKTLVTLVKYVCKQENVDKLPMNVPVLVVSGSDDPVGAMGEGVRYFYDQIISSGKTNASLKLFEGDRHEVLNETDRADVYEYIYNWMSEASGTEG